MGLGLHSSSFVDGKRWKNTDDIKKYIENCTNHKDIKEDVEVLDKNSQIEECIMLALRTNLGINLENFKNQFGFDLYQKKQKEIDNLIAQNLLVKTATNLCCTQKGFDYLNQIILQLID